LDGRSAAFDVNGAALVEVDSKERSVHRGVRPKAKFANAAAFERPTIWRRPEPYGALSDLEATDPLAQSGADTIAEERKRNIAAREKKRRDT
jgi:hypothetical protein